MRIIDDLQLPIRRTKMSGKGVEQHNRRKESNSDEQASSAGFRASFEKIKDGLFTALRTLIRSKGERGMACQHMNFRSSARIGRLSDVEGGPITGYTAEIRIECTECGLPFRFRGLAAGSHYAEPRVSVDGTELRAPIEPAYTTEICGHPLVAGRA